MCFWWVCLHILRTKMIMNTVTETACNYSCQHPEGKTIHCSPLTLFSVKVPPCHSHLLASDRGTSNSCSVVGWNANRVKSPELSFYKLVNQKKKPKAKVDTGNEMWGISRKNGKTIIIQLVTVANLASTNCWGWSWISYSRYHYLHQGFIFLPASVCLFGWFVSRITQELLNGFIQNLDGGWVLFKNTPD